MKQGIGRRLWKGSLLLGMAGALIGCGTALEKGSEVSIEEAAMEGLAMYFAEDAALLTPEGATVLVENTSGRNLSYGQGYAVQVCEEGVWYELEPKTSHRVMTGELLWLPDGCTDTYQFGWRELYGKLPDGTYRIAKSYADYTEGYWATAPFIVENGTAAPMSDSQ